MPTALAVSELRLRLNHGQIQDGSPIKAYLRSTKPGDTVLKAYGLMILVK